MPYARVLATFAPRRTDDLETGADAYIGKRGVFEEMWTIEDGPYAGEMAMLNREWKADCGLGAERRFDRYRGVVNQWPCHPSAS